MKTAATLAVLAITLLPSFAFASCKGDKMEETAASCIAGTTWDTEKGTCVENPTS
ncbi:hypothetical protein [Tabrizicola sp.]|uniref:hypothetical protein n=1 Tax=Tabrizicola sp. TaxID=2005166 RepID=UPI003F3DAA39